jgi:hypothetical protein
MWPASGRGRLVAEYLGAAGSLMLSVSLAILCFVALLAYYIGRPTDGRRGGGGSSSNMARRLPQLGIRRR